MRRLMASVATVFFGVAGLYPVSQEQVKPQGQAQESTSQQTRTHLTRAALSITYKNTKYGFCFSLPRGWKGYSIARDTWKGYANVGPQGDVTVAHGPIVTIRHPLWVSEVPARISLSWFSPALSGGRSGRRSSWLALHPLDQGNSDATQNTSLRFLRATTMHSPGIGKEVARALASL